MARKSQSEKITFFLTGLFGGGGERVMLDLAHGLADEGTPVDIVVMQKRGPLVEQVHENVELVDLSCKRIAQSIPRLAHYMRKERPKAIIATSEHANVALVLARMMSFTRTNVILRIGIAFSVVFGRYKKRRDKLIATLAPVLYRRADKIVCVSEGIAEDFARETGIARDRLIVIHNPKDIEHIRTRAKEKVTHPWFAQKTFPVVLGVGRLRGQKDFATLIEAVALARKDISDLHLIILGEGEEHDALIKLAEKEGVADAVDLPGFVQNPYPYMAHADVFALSSLWEGMPNALVEAMAVGTPVVAADCPSGPREVLAPDADPHDHTINKNEHTPYGILTPMGDRMQLAEAITEMLSDDKVRQTYKVAAQKRASDFALAHILKEYEQLWADDV